jgi:two-component system, OmpR family, copper resistance phosphate regulon response regulator CusR
LRILLVEDERKTAEALQQGLEDDGYSVEIAHTGEEGFFRLNSGEFDLAILDVMLPGRTGVEVLFTARKTGLRIPVLLLTAKDAIEDRVRGLDAGADDYLVKPFAFAELSARVRALLRRGNGTSATSLQCHDLQMNLITRAVTRSCQPIELTTREFDLLQYLLLHSGEVVSRAMIARDVWKEVTRHPSLDNAIDVHMMRLRKKLDEDFSPRLLHTVRGVGFVLRVES